MACLEERLTLVGDGWSLEWRSPRDAQWRHIVGRQARDLLAEAEAWEDEIDRREPQHAGRAP